MPTTLEQPSELVNLLRLTRQPEVRLGIKPDGWEDLLPDDEPLRLGDWPITVYEAADYLRLPADDSHELLKYLIAGACAIVESYTGRGLTIARWLQRSILQRGFVTFARAPVGNYDKGLPRRIKTSGELSYCSTLVHPQLDLMDTPSLSYSAYIIWLLDKIDLKLYAYDLITKVRYYESDIILDSDNNTPIDIYANDTTMWVLDDGYAKKLYAYTIDTKDRDSTKDIALHSDNAHPRGIWSDGTTMWVVDSEDIKIYAYEFDGTRDTYKDFTTLSLANNRSPHNIWSDGQTMWVIDDSDINVYAYKMNNKSRNSVLDFNTLSSAGNTDPIDVWSDGSTLWVLDSNKIYAYNLKSKNRVVNREFNLHSDNSDPKSIWSDGVIIWVVDGTDTKIYSYILNGGIRYTDEDENKDIDLDSDNSDPRGIWSDGITLWVVDSDDTKLYAYNIRDKSRDENKDINLDDSDNSDPRGIWSDGITLWVVDSDDTKLYAYNMVEGYRDAPNDVDLYSGNANPLGIWSDGTTMWVVDSIEEQVYAYNLIKPDHDTNKDLNTIAVEGNNAPAGIWGDSSLIYSVIPEINGVLDRNFRGRATKLSKVSKPDDKVGKLTYSYNAWGLFCRGYDITIDYWGGYADPSHIEPDLKYAVLVLVYYGFSNPYEMNQVFENSGVKDLLRHYVPKTGEDENY